MTWLILKPGYQVLDCLSGVLLFNLEIRVVFEGFAIIEQRSVDKMPIKLPLATKIIVQLIGVGSAFYHTMLFRLSLCLLRHFLSHDVEKIVNII